MSSAVEGYRISGVDTSLVSSLRHHAGRLQLVEEQGFLLSQFNASPMTTTSSHGILHTLESPLSARRCSRPAGPGAQY
eukprot:38608-Eustigmatos_ZCMA.PRE.1